ncbi:WecB/TagA/CpsF family glycosyltransferase [Mesobacillus sp. S13]|uniref:WecB/TagA/CpsF family glycosyltransferase n=1 Tax=Mesobacillus sp. S13 TaxID=2880221 RepID=UPI001CF3C128|nr:WecB/TagA/CpsF family glycosyltransferase [Mesobacillus sp. S13]
MRDLVDILGVKFVRLSRGEILSQVEGSIDSNGKMFVVTANPEIVMHAKDHPDYMRTVSNADMVIADGIGVIIGSKILNTPLPERVAGFDLLTELLKRGNEKNWRVFFLGAKDEVLQEAVGNVKKDYPNLVIAGSHHGYFKDDDTKVADLVREAQADMVFVALGFPRQEKWIEAYMPSFDKGLFMGVGGSFDVLAGHVQRAPEIWQKLNLEWLYRLLKQPSRWKRMLTLPMFILEVVKEKNRRKR